jgi:hypothetical protein
MVLEQCYSSLELHASFMKIDFDLSFLEILDVIIHFDEWSSKKSDVSSLYSQLWSLPYGISI